MVNKDELLAGINAIDRVQNTRDIRKWIRECFEHIENVISNEETSTLLFNITDGKLSGTNIMQRNTEHLLTLDFDNKQVKYIEKYNNCDNKEIQNYFQVQLNIFNDKLNLATYAANILEINQGKALRLINAIKNYYLRENFDYTSQEIKDVLKAKKLDLAYTTLGDNEQFNVQTSFDLNSNKYIYEINNEDVTNFARAEEQKAINILDFIEDLNYCNFDDMLREHYSILETIYGENWEKVDIQNNFNELGADISINYGEKTNNAQITVYYEGDSYSISVPSASNNIDLINQIRKQVNEINCPMKVYSKINMIADGLYKSLEQGKDKAPNHDFGHGRERVGSDKQEKPALDKKEVYDIKQEGR